MHRIPYGINGPSSNKRVVYLQHGILFSSANWILAGIEKGFAYILAYAGYTVWMPNVRGTRYSRKHVSLHADKDKKQFWNFSSHEIAVYDVPAMVDYVTDVVKQEKIVYIGHSRGTLVFYVTCSENPEYNKKFKAIFSVAPISYMKWMTSPLMRIIAKWDDTLFMLLNLIGMYEFLPTSGYLAQLGETFCSDDSIFQILFTNSLFAVCGFNPDQMHATLLPVIMGHTPAGASTKQLIHFAQEVNSGKFRQFDYGKKGNKKRYGSKEQPKYTLKNVKVPVYLYYSKNDRLSHPNDVDKLYKELGNSKSRFLPLNKKFNHVDYLYGIDAPIDLYSRVIGLMNKL